MKNHSWREKAKCKEVDDPDVFFPVVRDGNGAPVLDAEGFQIEDYSEEGTEEARSYCVQCPVIFECLRANLNEEHGIFADTNPKERWAMKRRKKK